MIISTSALKAAAIEINACEGEAVVKYENETGLLMGIRVPCGIQVLCDKCMDRLVDIIDWAEDDAAQDERQLELPLKAK